MRTERCIEFSLEQPYFYQSLLNALISFDLNDLKEPKWKFKKNDRLTIYAEELFALLRYVAIIFEKVLQDI